MTDRRQPAGHVANSTKYKKLRASFMKKQGRFGYCSICDQPIDMSLSGRLAAGPSIDHIRATSAGGDFWDMSNWALSHRACNAKKGRGGMVGVARRSGPVPGDSGYCWIKGMDGWMHINPIHGEPDHWNCQWPGCRHGDLT